MINKLKQKLDEINDRIEELEDELEQLVINRDFLEELIEEMEK